MHATERVLRCAVLQVLLGPAGVEVIFHELAVAVGAREESSSVLDRFQVNEVGPGQRCLGEPYFARPTTTLGE